MIDLTYVTIGICCFLLGCIVDMYCGNHKDLETMIENGVLKYKNELLREELWVCKKKKNE